jgi:hypothetical protein
MRSLLTRWRDLGVTRCAWPHERWRGCGTPAHRFTGRRVHTHGGTPSCSAWDRGFRAFPGLPGWRERAGQRLKVGAAGARARFAGEGLLRSLQSGRKLTRKRRSVTGPLRRKDSQRRGVHLVGLGIDPRPLDDLAPARDHLTVVEHEDRHASLPAEPLDLGSVLGAGRPGPRLRDPALNLTGLKGMSRVVECLAGITAGMPERAAAPTYVEDHDAQAIRGMGACAVASQRSAPHTLIAAVQSVLTGEAFTTRTNECFPAVRAREGRRRHARDARATRRARSSRSIARLPARPTERRCLTPEAETTRSWLLSCSTGSSRPSR